MIIVSNASPLISLSKADLLFVLEKLFHKVFITPEVSIELFPEKEQGDKVSVVAPWLLVSPLSTPHVLDEWRSKYKLGLGELSTIILAKQLSANLAIIDEHKARTLALSEKVNVVGTIGILEESFRRRIITDLPFAYNKLIDSGTYIDRKIIENSLRKCK